MPLGSLLVLLLLATATTCGIGAVYYREVLIVELQQKLPDDALPRFPRSSWSFFSLMRQHQQHCPESRVRAVMRVLIGRFVAPLGGIALLGFLSAFLEAAASLIHRKISTSLQRQAWCPTFALRSVAQHCLPLAIVGLAELHLLRATRALSFPPLSFCSLHYLHLLPSTPASC